MRTETCEWCGELDDSVSVVVFKGSPFRTPSAARICNSCYRASLSNRDSLSDLWILLAIFAALFLAGILT